MEVRTGRSLAAGRAWPQVCSFYGSRNSPSESRFPRETQQTSSSSFSARCYFLLAFPDGFIEVQEGQITRSKLCAKASEKVLSPEAYAKLSSSASKDSGKSCSASELLSYIAEVVSRSESVISTVTLNLPTLSR